MKDWIDEWYNNQFDQIDLTPSSEVWENISQAMEDWPKHWYSFNAKDLGTKPRSNTWEQLNIHLSDERRVLRANRFSYITAAVASFLLLVIPLKTEDFLFSEDFQIASLAGFISSPDLSDPIRSNSKIQKEENTLGTVIADRRNSSFAYIDTINHNLNEETASILKDNSPYVLNRSILKSGITIDSEDSGDFRNEVNRMLPIRQTSLAQINLSRELSFNGVYDSKRWLSLSIMPQLSTLNNPMSQSSFSTEAKILPRLSLTYAFSAGHKLNKRNGLKLAVLFNNNKSLMIESDKVQRNINLRYLSLAALYTSSWNIGRQNRLRFNTEVGLFASTLTNKEVLFDEERVSSLEDGYGEVDAGAIFGVAISSKITNRWSLFTGVNTQIGLLNIFQGNQVIPSDFFKTSTKAVGLTIGFQYHL